MMTRPEVRVGFDAHHLAQPHTGNGVHTAGLLHALRSGAAAARIRLRAYGPSQDRELSGSRARRVLYDYAHHARVDRLDLLHTQYTAPAWSPVPFCMTIHDAAFARPGTPDFSRARLIAWRWQARRAAAVITVSNAARDDLVGALRLDETTVRVIPNGVTRVEPTPVESDRIAHALRTAQRPLIAYIGRLAARKRVPLLLSAFELFRQGSGGTLVVAGATGGEARAELLARQAEGVIRLESLTEGEKWALLDGVDAFAFLSEYEGFALPVVEAMLASVPVVVTPDPAVLEVSHGKVIVAEDSPASVAEALSRAVDARDGVLVRQAVEVAATYTWDKAARATLALYREIAGR